MRVLHVLDHSLPIGSGYSYRSRSIVASQKSLGLEPVVLTSPKQGTQSNSREMVAGIPHYRTRQIHGGALFERELRLVLRLASRIVQVAHAERIEVLHAHSPSLNGLASRETPQSLK